MRERVEAVALCLFCVSLSLKETPLRKSRGGLGQRERLKGPKLAALTQCMTNGANFLWLLDKQRQRWLNIGLIRKQDAFTPLLPFLFSPPLFFLSILLVFSHTIGSPFIYIYLCRILSCHMSSDTVCLLSPLCLSHFRPVAEDLQYNQGILNNLLMFSLLPALLPPTERALLPWTQSQVLCSWDCQRPGLPPLPQHCLQRLETREHFAGLPGAHNSHRFRAVQGEYWTQWDHVDLLRYTRGADKISDDSDLHCFCALAALCHVC